MIAVVDNGGEYSGHTYYFIDAEGYERADFEALVPMAFHDCDAGFVVAWAPSIEWSVDDYAGRLSDQIYRLKRSYGSKEWLALPDSAQRALLADLERHGGEEQRQLASAIKLNLGMMS